MQDRPRLCLPSPTSRLRTRDCVQLLLRYLHTQASKVTLAITASPAAEAYSPLSASVECSRSTTSDRIVDGCAQGVLAQDGNRDEDLHR